MVPTGRIHVLDAGEAITAIRALFPVTDPQADEADGRLRHPQFVGMALDGNNKELLHDPDYRRRLSVRRGALSYSG